MEQTLTHKFVEFIPREIEEDVLYVSIEYGTARHKCFCGCGEEIVTPITPTDWKLTYDGETVSLSPSIGSWNLPCQSHYFIRNNKVVWAYLWSKEEIALGREADKKSKQLYYRKSDSTSSTRDHHTQSKKTKYTNPLGQWLSKLFGRR